MAALWQRQTTGEGQQVEASLHDTMLSMGRAWFALQRFGGEVHGTTSHHQRNGNRAKTAGDLYPCKGGDRFDQVYILCMETRPMWRALLELVGRPDLAAVDPDPFNPSDQYSRAVDESISAWTSQHDKFEAMRLLGEAGIPAGAVLTPDEVIADPHNAAREMIVEVEHPSYGKCHILGSPLKLSASELRIDAPAFELGEHTDEVLGDLGYSAEQVRAARNDKS
jgi:formyl-CoA transferase